MNTLFDARELKRILHEFGVNLLYWVSPTLEPSLPNLETAVRAALDEPVGLPKLSKMVRPGMRVLIVADDMTRPTPQSKLIPPLLNYLNECGIPDRDITVLIALGTHRPMSPTEIQSRFGREVLSRVKVINHDFSDKNSLFKVGKTRQGTPIVVNRHLVDADLSIGCGMVAPHAQFGWSGGAKIVMPGICGEETVEGIHWETALRPDYLGHAARLENDLRCEMEEVATTAGLTAILNVVLDYQKKPVRVVFGHPVAAHRELVKEATNSFVRPIPARADIVIIDARPADLDYWQGLKPLTFGTYGVRPGGTLILVGDFADGISQTHPSLEKYGALPRMAIPQYVYTGDIEDRVAAAALIQHAAIKEMADVVCVSPGLLDKAEALGFGCYRSVAEALENVLRERNPAASIGILELGGEVVPYVKKEE